MLWAFFASPSLSARRPPRISRHAPARSQLSVSIFDLVAGQDDTRLADLPALCQWVEGAGGDGLVAVEVESTPDRGLGLRTTQAVKRGDVLLSVPMTLALGNPNPSPNPNTNPNTNTNADPDPDLTLTLSPSPNHSPHPNPSPNPSQVRSPCCAAPSASGWSTLTRGSPTTPSSAWRSSTSAG